MEIQCNKLQNNSIHHK